MSSGRIIVLFPVFALLFSFMQYESILWESTLSVYLMLFSAVLTFRLLDTSKGLDRNFWLSCVTATIASYSFFNGILTWPVGFVQIISRESRRRTYCWIGVGVSNLFVYFYGWTKPFYLPPWTFALYHPIDGATYFFTLTGAVFEAYNVHTALILGVFASIIGLLVVVQSYRKGILRSSGLWFSLILFAFFSSLAETVGRSGFGVFQALSIYSSRYTPMTALGLAGLYLLASSLSKTNRKLSSKSLGGYALLALLLLGLLNAYGTGWQIGQQSSATSQIGAYVLLSYDVQSSQNIERYLYPSAATVELRAPFVKQNALNVFNDRPDFSQLTSVNSSTLHSLDIINGIIVSQHSGPIVINATQDSTITLGGWAVDGLTNSAALTVVITVDKTDIPTIYGIGRSDVSTAYNNPNFRSSGFVAFFSASAFGPGLHTVGLKVISKDHRHYYYLQQVASYVIVY